MGEPTVDLHMHSTASDGSTNPAALVQEAAASGLKTIAFCDHESIEGYLETVGPARELGIEVIPGVELVTIYQGREIHLLGYYVGADSPELTGWLQDLRQDRNQLAVEVVDKLNHYGYKITFERVREIARANVAIGKNHYLVALIEAGYIRSREEIIYILRNYLSHKGLAYVDFTNNPYYEAVEMILECGGIPVLAHPGLIRDDNLVQDLMRHPRLGMEVYYYYLNGRQQLVAKYEKYARENGLIMTGGSDYHGRFSPDVKLGELMVPENVVSSLKAETRRAKGVLQVGL